MEIVVMMNVQTPSSNVRDVDIKSLESGSLSLPNNIGTSRVFVTNGYYGLSNTIHLEMDLLKFTPRITWLVISKGF